MLRRLSFPPRLALALLCIAALAQSAETPVPVRDEPNHRVTFENDYLRMIEVHIPAGVTTLYHLHTIPSVVIRMSRTTIVSQEWGAAPPAPSPTAPGETRYAPYDEKPLTHRVTNRGPGVFQVLDIELLRPLASIDPTPPTPPPDFKLEWEQNRVRLYQLPLAAGKQTGIAANGCAHLLVSVSGAVQTSAGANATGTNRELKAGGYLYFAPHRRLQIGNRGTAAASCLLLELR